MKYIGKDSVIEVSGKKYKLARFSRAVLRDFLDWCNTVIPNPFQLLPANFADLDPKVQELCVKKAFEKASLRLSIQSPEVQHLLTTHEGMFKLVYLLFQKYHPDLTDDKIEDILDRCEEEHGLEYLGQKLAECAGQMPVDLGDAERDALEDLGVLDPAPSKKS